MASYAPLFGHVDGWQWKPNLIWVDNLKTMPTPNYHVQKLYANYKGSQIVPILYKDKMPATGQDSLYASATLDKTSNELIIKIVNASANAKTAEVNIDGVKKLDVKAKLITLQNDDLEAENTIDLPTVVAPVEKEIEVKGKKVELEVKGYSFSVIRVKL
jgi:alpha-L-arabinofuranosidase